MSSVPSLIALTALCLANDGTIDAVDTLRAGWRSTSMWLDPLAFVPLDEDETSSGVNNDGGDDDGDDRESACTARAPLLFEGRPLMAHMTGLRLVSMRSARLDMLPDALAGSAQSLECLHLGENRLCRADSLPAWFAGFTALRTLDLYGNRLTVVPDALRTMTGLVHLNLSSNYLACLPDWFGDTFGGSLQTLGLCGAFRGHVLLSRSFRRLANLTHLMLCCNGCDDDDGNAGYESYDDMSEERRQEVQRDRGERSHIIWGELMHLENLQYLNAQYTHDVCWSGEHIARMHNLRCLFGIGDQFAPPPPQLHRLPHLVYAAQITVESHIVPVEVLWAFSRVVASDDTRVYWCPPASAAPPAPRATWTLSSLVDLCLTAIALVPSCADTECCLVRRHKLLHKRPDCMDRDHDGISSETYDATPLVVQEHVRQRDSSAIRSFIADDRAYIDHVTDVDKQPDDDGVFYSSRSNAKRTLYGGSLASRKKLSVMDMPQRYMSCRAHTCRRQDNQEEEGGECQTQKQRCVHGPLPYHVQLRVPVELVERATRGWVRTCTECKRPIVGVPTLTRTRSDKQTLLVRIGHGFNRTKPLIEHAYCNRCASIPASTYPLPRTPWK